MRNIFLLVILLFIILPGCNKNNGGCGCYPGPVSLSILVENTEGQNMLMTTTPHHYKAAEIKRYDLINGKEKLYYEGHLDNHNGYSITTYKDTAILHFVPDMYAWDKMPETTTYIQWDAANKDTVKCIYEKDAKMGYRNYKEIYYNGKKVYPGSNNTLFTGYGLTIKVVK